VPVQSVGRLESTTTLTLTEKCNEKKNWSRELKRSVSQKGGGFVFEKNNFNIAREPLANGTRVFRTLSPRDNRQHTRAARTTKQYRKCKYTTFWKMFAHHHSAGTGRWRASGSTRSSLFGTTVSVVDGRAADTEPAKTMTRRYELRERTGGREHGRSTTRGRWPSGIVREKYRWR